MNNIKKMQETICHKYNTECHEVSLQSKLGFDMNVSSTTLQINGLRHLPENDTNGWYIYAGADISEDIDFFEPLHTKHLIEFRPEIIKYLALPPGWRFLIHGDYEDVWYDEDLLKV